MNINSIKVKKLTGNWKDWWGFKCPKCKKLMRWSIEPRRWFHYMGTITNNVGGCCRDELVYRHNFTKSGQLKLDITGVSKECLYL